jgi:enterochelin esterase-like enzyme
VLLSFPAVDFGPLPARRVDVWWPDQHAARPLPLIVAHDGQNLFNWKTSYTAVPWALDRAVQRLQARTTLPGAIIVGVWNIPAVRLLDYGPQLLNTLPAAAGFRAYARNATMRGEVYVDQLFGRVLPDLLARLPQLPPIGASYTLGSSMGGLISLLALSRFPALLSGAACFSTHWPAGGAELVDGLTAQLPAPGGRRLYFDFGTSSLDAFYPALQQHCDRRLQQRGFQRGRDFVSRAFPGAHHNERAWRSRAGQALQFLLGC